MELKITRTAKTTLTATDIETLIKDALKHQHPKVKVQRIEFNIGAPYPGGVQVVAFGGREPSHYLAGATVHLEVED